MSDWKAIEEDGGAPVKDGPPVILRGVLATEPAAYRRIYGRKNLTPLGMIILAMQRIIAWSFAAIVHLAAAAMLMTVYLEVAHPDDSVLFAKLWRENQPIESEKNEADKPVPAKIDAAPAMPKAPVEDPVKPPPIKMAKPLPLPPVPKPVPEPPKPDVPPSPDPIPAPAVSKKPKPATIGTGASAGGAAPAARGAIDGSDIAKDPGAALGKRRAGDLGVLRGGSAREIVVIKGVYDKVERVLESLKIPHRVVEADDFSRADLSKCRALLVNCHQTYPSSKNVSASSVTSMKSKITRLERVKEALERRVKQTRDRRTLSRLRFDLLSTTSELETLRRTLKRTTAMSEIREKVETFVADGGYLFTSDWGLSILEQAFPGWVRNGGSIGPKTVTIQAPRRMKSRELLEEVFYDPDAEGGGNTVSEKKFLWKIDTNSFLIDRRKTAIEVLVDCKEIKQHGAVAVVFSPKGSSGGRVLHILSHFQDQATEHGDYALQNLLLNFLLDRVRRGE